MIINLLCIFFKIGKNCRSKYSGIMIYFIFFIDVGLDNIFEYW